MQPRNTAKQSAQALLNEFEIKHSHFKKRCNLEQSFEMIERELSGYLSHPNSIYRSTFNSVRLHLFPGGLVFGRKNGISAGHDLITTLEKLSEKIPKLKNAELGISGILGYQLALELFQLRERILKKLVEFDQSWTTNLLANKRALDNLNHSLQIPSIPNLKPSEISLSRWGVLSFFYNSERKNKKAKNLQRSIHHKRYASE